MQKIKLILLSLLIFLPGTVFSEKNNISDTPVGEIEFISTVRGEVLIRSYSVNSSLPLSEGNFIYAKGEGGRIDFTVKEISGIYIKCSIEKNKTSPALSAREGMVVYDNYSFNSRLKYYDAKTLLRNLVNIYEDFIIDVESTEKPPLVAVAIAKFASNIETLVPRMAIMNEKYPELKNFDVSPPLVLVSESALLRKIEPRLKDVFYKIRGYMEDEDVKKEMIKLQSVLEQMKEVQ